MSQVALFALSHRPPTKFYGPVALVHELVADLFRLGRRVAEENRRIGAQFFAKCSAEKLINRSPGRLADDVPKGDFDAAHGLNDRPLPAEVDRAFVHAVNEPVDFEWIFSHNTLRKAAADLMRQGRLNNGPGH